jgi:sulfate adenylyltransferase subunit 1 (EFTu-like GTPase family)
VIKQSTISTRAVITELACKVDIATLENIGSASTLSLNDIGRILFKTAQPLIYDAYKKNRLTGTFILIDEATNATVAAGMLRSPLKPPPPPEYTDYAI